jgi:hypothetical protein
MLFKDWMAKFAAAAVSLLAVIGFFKMSNKKAADSRENELMRDNAEALIDGLERHKEIVNEVEKQVNDIDDIDKFAADNGFLREDSDSK